MLIPEQLCFAGVAHHAAQELAGNLRLAQPVTVFREARVIPDRLIERQSHEPAIQQVVAQRFAQEPPASDRVQNLQCRSPPRPFRRNRGAPFTGVHAIEIPTRPSQRLIRSALIARNGCGDGTRDSRDT